MASEIADILSPIIKKINILFGRSLPNYEVEDKYEQWVQYSKEVVGHVYNEKQFRDMFVKQTSVYYLSILYCAHHLKLLNNDFSVDQILEKKMFSACGLTGFIDSSLYFHWLSDSYLQQLAQLFQNCIDHNMDLFSDPEMLKKIYEYCISPHERHHLGEYYTPRWLSSLLIKHSIERKMEGSETSLENLRFLDPSCGSGEFLSQIVSSKVKSNCSLSSILETIHGYDINPIAGVMAKTNYILALKHLILDRNQKCSDESIQIPVYILDTLDQTNFSKLPTFSHSSNSDGRDPIKFDIIIGNPPWITYKDIHNVKKQRQLDKLIEELEMGAGSQNKTQQDIASLFVGVCQKILKDAGEILFLFPRSCFNSGQYNAIRKGRWKGPRINTIYDISPKINPFRIPSCALGFSNTSVKKMIGGYILNGRDMKSLKEKIFYLNQTQQESAISPVRKEDTWTQSPYKHKFHNGATLYPRSYIFVDVLTSKKKMDGAQVLKIKTMKKYHKESWLNKKGWKIISLLDSPSFFVYTCLLGDCIGQFRLKKKMKVFLPIIPNKESNKYEFVFYPKANKNHYQIQFDLEKFTNFLNAEYDTEIDSAIEQTLALYNSLEKDWEQIRRDKFDLHSSKRARRNSVLDNINYNQKLTKQHPSYPYMVVYNRSGDRFRATVVNQKKILIAGTVNFAYFEDEMEAYYICAILNSNFIIQYLKDLGIKSKRHLQKKVFEIYIPPYKGTKFQLKLAKLAINKRKMNGEMELLVEKIIMNAIESKKEKACL